MKNYQKFTVDWRTRGMVDMCDEDRMELVIARNVSPRLSGIESKLDVFTVAMNQILTQFAEEKVSSREARKELMGEVEEIKKILNGNGKDGLVATVNKLVEWMDNQKKWQGAIIGIFIAELIGMGFLLVKVFILRVP